MPVYTRRETSDPGAYWKTYERTGETQHEGLVLQVDSHEIKVMSDVWAVETYAIVWDPTTGTPKHVALYNTEFGGLREAEVDATPEVQMAYEAYRAEEDRKAKAAAFASACQDAQKRLSVPCLGCPAKVFKGRKVPVGTEGLVVWANDDDRPSRIGIRDDAGKIHYTAIDNAVRTDATLLDGESWLDAYRRLQTRRPYNGDRVKVLSGSGEGAVGTMFFCREGRVGIRLSNRMISGRFVDVVWADLLRVALSTDDISAPTPRPTTTVPAPVATEADIPF